MEVGKKKERKKERDKNSPFSSSPRFLQKEPEGQQLSLEEGFWEESAMRA